MVLSLIQKSNLIKIILINILSYGSWGSKWPQPIIALLASCVEQLKNNGFLVHQDICLVIFTNSWNVCIPTVGT